MWIHRQKLLEDSLSIQKLFHEAKQLDAMMGRQEGRLIDKDLLQHASTGQLQTFLDQQTQMIEAYAQLRQLESELDMHTQRIQQVFQDVVNTIVQHPKLADRLKIKLSEITSDWDELRRRIRDRIACMVQMHRAIIFQDGCLRLDLHTVKKRWAQIDAQKHYHRLLFDLGDEQIWIRERIDVANNQDLIHAVRRHTYLARCEELHDFIREKATQLPDDVGADFKIICQQVSQQNAFEQDFQATELQVQMINQTAEQLLPFRYGLHETSSCFSNFEFEYWSILLISSSQ
ncbi:unnamed protein product [Fasciola hepatica]|uniref:Spectrin repeat-containing domain protein n=1 Tax=Fasciola hepatica TaxID=6192 RepID=A0ABC9HGC3_FASHE